MYACFSWDLSPDEPHFFEIESLLAQLFHGRQLAQLLEDLFVVALASANDFDQMAGTLAAIQTQFPDELEFVLFELRSTTRMRPRNRPHWNNDAIADITA